MFPNRDHGKDAEARLPRKNRTLRRRGKRGAQPVLSTAINIRVFGPRAEGAKPSAAPMACDSSPSVDGRIVMRLAATDSCNLRRIDRHTNL